jgi:hypothetical protein
MRLWRLATNKSRSNPAEYNFSISTELFHSLLIFSVSYKQCIFSNEACITTRTEAEVLFALDWKPFSDWFRIFSQTIKEVVYSVLKLRLACWIIKATIRSIVSFLSRLKSASGCIINFWSPDYQVSKKNFSSYYL